MLAEKIISSIHRSYLRACLGAVNFKRKFSTQKFLLNFTNICATLFILSSCINDNNIDFGSNTEFQKKFATEVQRINAARAPILEQENASTTPENSIKKINVSEFANTNEILRITGSYDPSAVVDTTKFSLKNPEDFSPDSAKLNAARAAPKNLPDDMFDLNYDTELHPPFTVSGLEFDKIIIPSRDYYGISSNLNDKNYLLAGNDSLQPNIDHFIKSQTIEDIEFSKILIREQKQIKRQQKLARIFGQDEIFKSTKKADDEEEKPKIKIDNALQKAIALQIINQNIKHNALNADQKNKQQ